MNQVYNILDELRDHFAAIDIVNTVSSGDYTELDKDKTTIFPIVHVDIQKVTFSERQTLVFDILVLCVDLVDQDWAEEGADEFYRGTNIHDVYNEQLLVLNSLIQSLRRGDLYDKRLRLFSQPEATPFENRFDNMIAGWGAVVRIEAPNPARKSESEC